MILRCNFEELGALRHGARTFLAQGARGGAAVAAPAEGAEQVEAFLSRLSGDLGVRTLAEQRQLFEAVSAVVGTLREEMELAIIAAHAADEAAVASYFLFAHALTVLARLSEMGQEMEALIEVVTGSLATPEAALSFVFPA